MAPCVYLWGPEASETLAAGATGSGELPDKGAGNGTRVACESNRCSMLSRLSSPNTTFLRAFSVLPWGPFHHCSMSKELNMVNVCGFLGLDSEQRVAEAQGWM